MLWITFKKWFRSHIKKLTKNFAWEGASLMEPETWTIKEKTDTSYLIKENLKIFVGLGTWWIKELTRASICNICDQRLTDNY